MPQIGWLEILIIVVLAILIIGPKDFPTMLKKVGSWIGSIKNYFNIIQHEVSNLEDSVDVNIPVNEEFIKKEDDKKKDE